MCWRLLPTTCFQYAKTNRNQILGLVYITASTTSMRSRDDVESKFYTLWNLLHLRDLNPSFVERLNTISFLRGIMRKNLNNTVMKVVSNSPAQEMNTLRNTSSFCRKTYDQIFSFRYQLYFEEISSSFVFLCKRLTLCGVMWTLI